MTQIPARTSRIRTTIGESNAGEPSAATRVTTPPCRITPATTGGIRARSPRSHAQRPQPRLRAAARSRNARAAPSGHHATLQVPPATTNGSRRETPDPAPPEKSPRRRERSRRRRGPRCPNPPAAAVRRKSLVPWPPPAAARGEDEVGGATWGGDG